MSTLPVVTFWPVTVEERDVPLVRLSDASAAIAAERERTIEECARVCTTYKVPVGNSAAGEMAADWTLDALRECAAAIRALKSGAR